MKKRSPSPPSPPLPPEHPRKQRLLDSDAGLGAAEDEILDEEKPAVPALSAEGTKSETSSKIRKMPEVPLVVQYVGENFYVRDCYEIYFQILKKVLAENKRCVTITGTPGIGKSVFYAYCYDRFRVELTDTWVVAAAFEDSRFCRGILSRDGTKTKLYKFSQYEELEEAADEAKKKLLYLCDGPPHTTRHQMIVFTSPNEGWRKISRKHVCDYYMPLWTCEELQEAAALLDLHIDDGVIVKRFNKFGGVARECLCLEAEKLEVIERDILEVIQKFSSPEEVRNILLEIGNAEMCHRLLHFQPEQHNKQLKTTLLASPFLSQQLQNKMLQLLHSEREKYKSTIRGIAEAASLRGWIFEIEAHEILREGRELNLRLLPEGEKKSVWALARLVESEDIDVYDINNCSPSLLTRGPYHKPRQKTSESIDSFYLPKNNDNAGASESLSGGLLLFQMTVSATHPVNAWGIIEVLSKLDFIDKLDRVSLVFIVPRGLLGGFKRQTVVAVDTPTRERDIDSLRGIGPRTRDILSQYQVASIDDLVKQIEPYKRGDITMLNPKDQRAWDNAVKCWENHGQTVEYAAKNNTVAKIVQYACSLH